jgi:LssY C-terminus
MQIIGSQFPSAVILLALPLIFSPTVARSQSASDAPPPQQPEAPPASPSAPSPTASAPIKAKRRLAKDFTLRPETIWTDTGIDLRPGEKIVVTASGTLRYTDAKSDNGPEGLARGFKDLLRILPFNDSGRGSLIARIGDAVTAQPFLIGASHDTVSIVTGRLSLGINQGKNDSAEGSFTVQVEVYASDPSSSGTLIVAKSVTSIPGIDNSLFAKIPRRIADKIGNPGDMVNFLILGSEDAMQKVFTAAGWLKVDSDVKDALFHGLLDSLSKESYLTMPMSQLYLFGRPQDYGWAHAEPINVVRTRNHLRIWKAPFTVNGETLWVGAATHDIGFERDQRNNGLAHKIDPDIDLERAYVEKTLCSTGLVAEVFRFLPDDPMQEARTATGGSFHSNGQVLILKLANSAAKDLTTSSNR